MLTVCKQYTVSNLCAQFCILSLRASVYQEAIFRRCSVLIVVFHLVATSSIIVLVGIHQDVNCVHDIEATTKKKKKKTRGNQKKKHRVVQQERYRKTVEV
jgi:hypothetical protein